MISVKLCKHLTAETVQKLKGFTALSSSCDFPHVKRETDAAVRLWVCCECFTVGCSRISENKCMKKHALSLKHDLCYSPADQMLWCYACDMELHENLIMQESSNFPGRAEQEENLRNIDSYFQALRQPAQVEERELVIPSRQDNVFGLANLGNTCFFNSGLQALLSTPEFTRCLLAAKSQVSTDSMCTLLLELVGEGTTQNRHPRAVFHKLIKKNRMYSFYGQQDAHEALITILEMVEEELPHERALELPFTSFLAYNSYCLRCRLSQWFVEENTGIMLEVKDTGEHPTVKEYLHQNLREASLHQPLTPVNNAEFTENKNIGRSGLNLKNDHLSINNAWEQRDNCDLELLLSQFFDYQVYSRENNNYQCERCKEASTHGYTRYFILKSSPVFIICLKKFRAMARSFEKFSRRLSYKETIDFTPYALVKNRTEPDKLCYTLYAVVEHSGSLNGGHYVCYLRKDSGQWYYLSDAHYSPCTAAQALSADAYLLFYKKV